MTFGIKKNTQGISTNTEPFKNLMENVDNTEFYNVKMYHGIGYYLSSLGK